jgi:hypothetical protein
MTALEHGTLQEFSVVYDGPGSALNEASCSEDAKPPGWHANVGEKATFRTCSIDIDIKEDMQGPVFLYYAIEKMYQTHRRYSMSYSDAQLRGEFGKDKEFSKQLKHDLIVTHEDVSDENNSPARRLYPAGLLPASFFTDEFYDIKHTDAQTQETKDIALIETGIYEQRANGAPIFRNPNFYRDFHADSSQSSMPLPVVFLEEQFPYFRPFDSTTTVGATQRRGVENEHFKIWMKPNMGPGLRKIYGRLAAANEIIRKGTLKIYLKDRWDASEFNGSKRIIVANVSTGILEGHNIRPQYCLLATGVLYLFLVGFAAYKGVVNERPRGSIAMLEKDSAGNPVIM